MRRMGGAAAAAIVIMALAGCSAPQGPASSAPTVTETVSAPASSTPASSAAPAPSPSASAPASPSSSAPATTGADPGRPSGQCPDDAIGVAVVAADGGGGAGSEFFNVLFTNTSGDACVLRGTPGVSVVGKGNGTQLGPAANRIQTGAKDVRLDVGQSVAAPLKIVNIGTDGGPLPNCTVARGDGYRIYPPHSTRAFFVKDATAVACANGPVFMTVSPVIRFTD